MKGYIHWENTKILHKDVLEDSYTGYFGLIKYTIDLDAEYELNKMWGEPYYTIKCPTIDYIDPTVYSTLDDAKEACEKHLRQFVVKFRADILELLGE